MDYKKMIIELQNNKKELIEIINSIQNPKMAEVHFGVNKVLLSLQVNLFLFLYTGSDYLLYCFPVRYRKSKTFLPYFTVLISDMILASRLECAQFLVY